MRNDAISVVSMFAASQDDVFTRSQAAAQGIDHRRIARLLEGGLLAEPWRGMLIAVHGREPTATQLLRALMLDDRIAASHRGSGALHRLDGCDVLRLEASIEYPVNLVRAGVDLHRVGSLPKRDLVMVDGVRCTNIARTLADLGNVCPPDVVERAFDDALRRNVSVRWLYDTARRLHRPGVSGPRLLLSLLDAHQRRGTVRGSWFERLVEDCLAHPELTGLVQQYELRDSSGAHIATFDLAIPDARLGVEAHSRSHHFGEEREMSDEHRDHEAATAGWDVMYLGYASVRSPRTVRKMVVDRVRARRSLLGS